MGALTPNRGIKASATSVSWVRSVHQPRGVQGDVIIGNEICCHGFEGLHMMWNEDIIKYRQETNKHLNADYSAANPAIRSGCTRYRVPFCDHLPL